MSLTDAMAVRPPEEPAAAGGGEETAAAPEPAAAVLLEPQAAQASRAAPEPAITDRRGQVRVCDTDVGLGAISAVGKVLNDMVVLREARSDGLLRRCTAMIVSNQLVRMM
ncbi:hypothetical protein [Nakamurella sp. PAMC28650]|uniref:hypothetical protein n=1 Tax=Nakamurella sp. PAMC28650 TaxID=2762325 RepID=UPI00164D88BA|nr:hypothetical protein [Nakamurella sp. PAMC28650]QNK81165.1 hypothetical protein H7F38_24480 [Nakamurella sp. PAMC28650]